MKVHKQFEYATGVGKVDALGFSGSYLMVATSELEGNSWEGNVMVLDSTSGESLVNVRTDCGSADATWCGRARDGMDCVAVASDNGDIKVVQMLLKINRCYPTSVMCKMTA